MSMLMVISFFLIWLYGPYSLLYISEDTKPFRFLFCIGLRLQLTLQNLVHGDLENVGLLVTGVDFPPHSQ